MKKILSLGLAGVMMFSALPMAYAADVDYQTGTNVTVVGDGGEYFVTVPATLEPGQTGTVRAYGKWASNETVKVWTEDTVEVTHQDTGATTDVNVTFAGIESLGNDLEDMDVTANISIDKGDIRFGEWKGVIIYNVEFSDGLERLSITMVGDHPGETAPMEIVYEEGMTWREWVNSSYPTESPTKLVNNPESNFHNAIAISLYGYIIDENNNFVSPDAVIDPSTHYELYCALNWNEEDGGGKCGSPTFGAVEPTWP